MWSEQYEKLSTYEKTEFRRIGNYLLSHTYMVRFTYDSGIVSGLIDSPLFFCMYAD